MRKLSFILGIMAVLAFTSCNKEKNCTCVTSMSGTGAENIPDQTVKATIEDGNCSDGNSTLENAGMTATITCTED